eukprot:2268821-Alexandrium_andersonii.AAC.2
MRVVQPACCPPLPGATEAPWLQECKGLQARPLGRPGRTQAPSGVKNVVQQAWRGRAEELRLATLRQTRA